MSVKLPDGTLIAGFKVNDKVPLPDKALLTTGGTMTGPLILKGNPTSNLEAVPKQYVDDKIGNLDEYNDVVTYVDGKIKKVMSWGNF